MSPFFETTIKASLVLLPAFAAMPFLRGRSAAVRHWVLAASLICAAAVPVLGPLVPSWGVRLSSSPSSGHQPRDQRMIGISLTHQGSSLVQSERSLRMQVALTARRLVGPIWFAGVAVSLFVLVVGVARLAWLTSRAQHVRVGRWADLAEAICRDYGLRRTVRLRQSDHPTMLVTWGIVRPTIMLPCRSADWSHERIRVVLCHELAHVRRNDWLTQMGAELLRSFHWFNPLVWIACRQLREESEHACDDAVLKQGIEGLDYAAHLVSLARLFERSRRVWAPAPAMARLSSLEKRISAMLNRQRNHTPMKKITAVAIAIAVLSVTVPIAGFGVQVLNLPKVEEAILVLRPVDAQLDPSVSGRATNLMKPLADLRTRFARAGLRRQRNPDPCSVALSGGCVIPPVALRRVQPLYPQNLLDAPLDARVIVEGRIGTDGFLTGLRLVTVTSEFSAAVLDALRHWQFEAARLNGVPVESDITVTVDFR